METRVKISIDRITYWQSRPSFYNREFQKREVPVGHLHDDGFLLLRPEIILFFLSNLNLTIQRQQNRHDLWRAKGFFGIIVIKWLDNIAMTG